LALVVIVGSSPVRFADLRGTLAGSPAGFGKLIADETEKWAKVPPPCRFFQFRDRVGF